ncbi:hypothetical protein [Pseudorhodoferax sp. Leaf267]|nr:hypothetical protein [Pseudorhodoferax sp. Leaf267]
MLRDDCGLWGTMCHFDTKDMPLSDEMFDLKHRAARLMPRFLTMVV